MAMEYFHQRYIRKVYKVRQTGFCLFVCLFCFWRIGTGTFRNQRKWHICRYYSDRWYLAVCCTKTKGLSLISKFWSFVLVLILVILIKEIVLEWIGIVNSFCSDSIISVFISSVKYSVDWYQKVYY